jgi:hypothetical protein
LGWWPISKDFKKRQYLTPDYEQKQGLFNVTVKSSQTAYSQLWPECAISVMNQHGKRSAKTD